MTDPHAAAVFAEFSRIGLVPDTIGAPLIATGFTRRSLIDWLQRIPTGVGADDLRRRLALHAQEALARAEAAGASAEDDPQRVDPTPAEGEVQWWPTTLVLDAGIQVMAEEWDPIGVWIDSVPPEDLGEYTLGLFWPLLHRWSRADPLEPTTVMIAALEGSLGLRESPKIHRRYLAARLREVVARTALPVREAGPSAESTMVSVGSDDAGPSRREPDAVCDRCRTFGTISRVTTKSEPPRVVRFCARCWREVRSRYMSDDRDPLADAPFESEPTSVASRSWDDVVDFVRLVLNARQDPVRGAEITTDLLSQLATEIATEAGDMDGPMPDEIDHFLREYAPAP